MTKTTLFKLAELAGHIVVSGYSIEHFNIDQHFADGRTTLRLCCCEDNEFYFEDAEVELLEDGEVLAHDCNELDDEADLYRLRFTVERPLTLADIEQANAAE